MLLVASAVAGVVYLRRQRRETVPLFPLDLLRIPVFALSMCTSVAAFAAQALAFVAVPFLLLEAYGRTHTVAGLIITAWPIATLVSAPIAGRLIGRVGDGLLGAVGLLTMATGSRVARRAAGRAGQRRHRLADVSVRLRLRALPVAQQPRDPDLGAAGAKRRRERHARDGAVDGSDHRCRAAGRHLQCRGRAQCARTRGGVGLRCRLRRSGRRLQRVAASCRLPATAGGGGGSIGRDVDRFAMSARRGGSTERTLST